MKKIIILLLFFISTTQPTTWKYGDIHIIGDSHSIYSFTNLYTQGIPGISESQMSTCEVSTFDYSGPEEVLSIPFQIHWISRTMHMIGKLGLEQVDFRNYNMKNGDFGVLIFGGIDAYHGSIIKQYVLGRELDEIIEKLAKKYIKTALLNKNLYNKLDVIIMGVIPPIILGHNKHAYQQRDPDLPFEKFIVVTNRKLNEALAYHCKINNLMFLDVTSSFEDKNGLLPYQLSAGDHHIKPAYNYIIKQKLIDIILDNIQNEANHALR